MPGLVTWSPGTPALRTVFVWCSRNRMADINLVATDVPRRHSVAVRPIVLRSSEDPRPGLKEVLMRVRASSLNYRDLMVLKGGGRGPTKIGVVPLSDGAGEVAAIGEGVTRVKIGDRIAGCFHPRWFAGPIKPAD